MHDAIKQYEGFVDGRWLKTDDKMRDLFHVSAGLAGESGEVLELIKKSIIPGREKPYSSEKMALELGDVMYYVTRLAAMHGLTLGDVIEGNMMKLTMRGVRGTKDEAAEENLMYGIRTGTIDWRDSLEVAR